MAKRQATSTTEEKIEAFAEDLGRLLGSARSKADTWLNQRRQIAKHLTDIRDTASHLLTQLGEQTNRLRGKQSKPAVQDAPAPISRKKRRKMSAKARAAISAAQKARWAKVKGDKGKG